MTHTLRHISTFVALVALVCSPLLATPPAGAEPRTQKRTRLAIVDVDRIGFDRLEALKSAPGVTWWVELDDQLLVAAGPRALERLSNRYEVRILEGRFAESELAILRGQVPEDAEVRVLAEGGRMAVAAGTPEAFSRLEASHLDGEDDTMPHAHLQVMPFVPNVVLAHQAANDPVRLDSFNRFDVAIQALVDSVDGVRWRNDVQTLTGWNRYTRNAGNLAARDWLAAQFEALPGMTVSTPSFTFGATTSYNVVAKLTGTTRPDDWYIVGGHFDSISNNDNNATAPGAEDNGSGTAGVLEMARIFAANPPDATVLFICYSGEEQGLHGSIDHASDLVATGDDAKIHAVLTMDMIGYTGDADLDCLLETGAIGQFMINAYSAAAAQYTNLRIVSSLNPFGSDHVPYLNRGMPALLTIENDWSSYPGYHRSTDLIANVNLEMGSQILKMNVAALAQMIGTAPSGNGDETAGIYGPTTGAVFLRNSNSPGVADVTFQYGPGNPAWIALSGDWNGDGTDTIGLFDPASGFFFLRNSNSSGAADLTFNFGLAGTNWTPLVGDWDGNGTDTVGLYNPANGTFFLRNSNTAGAADLAFVYGPPGAKAVVGDWDGNGTDTVGIYSPSTSFFFLRNSNSPGVADLTFSYGPAGAGWIPVAGDWNDDNAVTVGLYNPAVGAFFLRNANSAGAAHFTFTYGPPTGYLPLLGDWNNL